MGWYMFINQRPWQHCLSRFKRRIGINLRCLQQGGLQHNAFASNSIPSNPWLHFNMERIQLRATDRSKIILWKSRKETLAASFSRSRLLPGGKENWRFPPIINGVRGCWCFGTIIYCSFCKWWQYILCVSCVCFLLTNWNLTSVLTTIESKSMFILEKLRANNILSILTVEIFCHSQPSKGAMTQPPPPLFWGA